jgi:hypothetical protein
MDSSDGRKQLSHIARIEVIKIDSESSKLAARKWPATIVTMGKRPASACGGGEL